MSFKKQLKNTVAGGLVGLTSLVGSVNKADAGLVSYSPDQIGSVSAPIIGLGETSSDYLLTTQFGVAKLDKDFNGNNQETGIFGNPQTAQDAASLDDTYMFQLSTTDGIRKVDLSNGNQVFINGQIGINAGANAFGIGYDPSSNAIGIGRFDGSTMSFSSYDIGTGTLSPLVSFAFDPSAYGTPTGLDFKDGRMIVGTRDQKDNKFAPEKNFILDMDALTGSIDQYATISGSSSKLQDVLYSDGRLATSYKNGGTGIVGVGDFTTVPEPSSLALGLGGLALLYRRKT